MTNQQKKIRINLTNKVIAAVITIVVVANAFLAVKFMDMQDQFELIQKEVEGSRRANENVLAMLKEIRNEQEKQSRAMQIKHEKKDIAKNTILTLKHEGFSVNTDLGTNTDLTVDDMNKIISYYEAEAFEGHGEAFILASKETGLSPIYLFAHAAAESGFGTSYLARDRHNYYGIAAFDNDPNAAYGMGSNIDEGIINGAKWIKKHYYDDGDKTLSEMHESYASDPEWANQITRIANKAIEVL